MSINLTQTCLLHSTSHVKMVIVNRSMVNRAIDNGATPLFTACFNGRLDVVRLLLARKDIHCNHPTKNGATPLLIASQEGHFEIVDALLQMNGIRVGRSDIYGNTPIDVARQHGHQKIVDVLIAAS